MKVKMMLLVIVTTLLSCSTMTKNECLNANWYEIGFSDGSSGYTTDFFNERSEDCAKYGVMANSQVYMQARKEGLKNYCTQANGYEQGYNGRTYRGVCQGNSAQQFLSGYREGNRIYKQRVEVGSIEDNIRAAERDIAKYYDEQYQLEKQIIDESNQVKRAHLVLEMKQVGYKINELKLKKQQLLQRYKIAKKRLNNLQK